MEFIADDTNIGPNLPHNCEGKRQGGKMMSIACGRGGYSLESSKWTCIECGLEWVRTVESDRKAKKVTWRPLAEYRAERLQKVAAAKERTR